MLEPLDIDINLNQNISDEAPRATQASAEMTQSVVDAQKEIERLQKVIKDMSTALAEQEKIIEASNADYSEATQRIESMRQALDQAQNELRTYKEITEQANKAVEEGADMTEILEEVTGRLSDTQSDLTDTAESLIENQEEISEAIDESTESVNTNSASNRILSDLLNKVAEALGIENAQIRNSFTNVKVITALKNGWANAVSYLTKEIGMSTVASKAFLISGVGAIIAGIAAAVIAYRALTREKREANKLLEEQKRLMREAAASVQEEVSKIKVLESILKDNNRSYNERNNALKQLKSIVPAYEAHLTREGELIEANSIKLTEYINKLRDQAISKRVIEKLATAQTDYDDWLANLSDPEKKIIQKDKSDFDPNDQATIGYWNMLDKIKKKKEAEIERLETLAKKYVASDTVTIQDGTKAFWEDQKKQAEDILATMTDAEKGSERWNKEVEKINEANKKLELWDIDKKSKTPKTPRATPAEKADTSLEKMSYDIQKRISDARVKAIREGADRERAAAKAEYEETQAYIERKLKEIAELEKKTGTPATQQRTELVELGTEAKRQYENETNRINAKSKADIDTIFTEVNARFASELDRNIADINAYYSQLIAEATKAGASIEEVQRLKDAQQQDTERANIYDQLRQTDLNEALDMERAANMESIGLTTIAEQMKYEIAKNYLEQRIALLRKIGDESSNKEADILQERLKGLQNAKAPKSITGLVNGKIFSTIQKGLEKTGMSAEDAQSKTSELFAGMQQGGATAANVIGEMQSMFGGLDEGLDGAMEAAGNIAQGFAQGGPMGAAMAAIGEGIKVFSQYKKVDAEHEQALKELALAKLELQRKYNLLLLEEQLYYKQGTNIFGTDQIRGAVNSINTYKDTIVSLKDEMRGEKPDEMLGKRLEAMANSGSPLLASIASKQLEDYNKKVEAYKKGIGALADVDIVTGSKKSGALWWRKRKDVYEPLLKVYDDLIDKEGKLNTARIQTVLDTHKMSDENKALLQSLLDLSEAADQAEEKLTEYLNQTFGSLGDSLANSIIEGWKNGTNDGLEIFRGGVTDVLNDFAAQMIHTLFLKELFDSLDKDIRQAYDDLAEDKLTERQLSDKITNILGGFFGGLDDDVEKANKFLDEFWKNAEAAGFERPEGEREGTKGGFANASQDSVNELTGGVYAVRQIVGDIRNDNRELLLIERTIATQLDVLVERSEYWFFLEELKNVAESLDNIETYGVKISGL